MTVREEIENILWTREAYPKSSGDDLVADILIDSEYTQEKKGKFKHGPYESNYYQVRVSRFR